MYHSPEEKEAALSRLHTVLNEKRTKAAPQSTGQLQAAKDGYTQQEHRQEAQDLFQAGPISEAECDPRLQLARAQESIKAPEILSSLSRLAVQRIV